MKRLAPRSTVSENLKEKQKPFRLQAKRFFLTWSQTGDWTLQHWIESVNHLHVGNIQYYIVARELHKDEGVHFHSVIIYTDKITIRDPKAFDIQGYHPNIKTLPTNGDLMRAIAYCKKGKDWEAFGESPIEVDKLTRLAKIALIKEKTIEECIETGKFSFSEIRCIPMIKYETLPKWPNWRKRSTIWLHGKTGIGKTRWAVTTAESMMKEYAILSGDLRTFMLGYTGQPIAIMDDLRPGTIKFELLLRILDGYRCTVNVKGSLCPWLAEVIIITAPIPPMEMYVNHDTGIQWDNLDQLIRRLDHILEVTSEPIPKYEELYKEQLEEVSETEEL